MLELSMLLLIFAVLLLLSGCYFLIYSTKNKTKFGVNLAEVACPECGSIQPKIRKPQNLRQTLWGGSTCVCGCELDKYGNKINM